MIESFGMEIVKASDWDSIVWTKRTRNYRRARRWNNEEILGFVCTKLKKPKKDYQIV